MFRNIEVSRRGIRNALALSVTFSLIMLLSQANEAVAASENECAIWLCAPGGFPNGCEPPHAAMMSRIKRDKSPIPDWNECFSSKDVPGGGSGSANYGPVAYIPEHQVCVRWKSWGSDGERCVEHKTIPEEYRKGTRCRTNRDGERTPAHCTKSLNYIDVFIDGKKQGETYYY